MRGHPLNGAGLPTSQIKHNLKAVDTATITLKNKFKAVNYFFFNFILSFRGSVALSWNHNDGADALDPQKLGLKFLKGSSRSHLSIIYSSILHNLN